MRYLVVILLLLLQGCASAHWYTPGEDEEGVYNVTNVVRLGHSYLIAINPSVKADYHIIHKRDCPAQHDPFKQYDRYLD